MVISRSASFAFSSLLNLLICSLLVHLHQLADVIDLHVEHLLAHLVRLEPTYPHRQQIGDDPSLRGWSQIREQRSYLAHDLFRHLHDFVCIGWIRMLAKEYVAVAAIEIEHVVDVMRGHAAAGTGNRVAHACPVISGWPSKRLICSLNNVTTSRRSAPLLM